MSAMLNAYLMALGLALFLGGLLGLVAVVLKATGLWKYLPTDIVNR